MAGGLLAAERGGNGRNRCSSDWRRRAGADSARLETAADGADAEPSLDRARLALAEVPHRVGGLLRRDELLRGGDGGEGIARPAARRRDARSELRRSDGGPDLGLRPRERPRPRFIFVPVVATHDVSAREGRPLRVIYHETRDLRENPAGLSAWTPAAAPLATDHVPGCGTFDMASHDNGRAPTATCVSMLTAARPGWQRAPGASGRRRETWRVAPRPAIPTPAAAQPGASSRGW